MSDPISSLKGLEADVKAKLEAQSIKNTQHIVIPLRIFYRATLGSYR